MKSVFVKFMAWGKSKEDIEDAITRGLNKNCFYRIYPVHMDKFNTYVFLEDIAGGFSSAMFEFYDEQGNVILSEEGV